MQVRTRGKIAVTAMVDIALRGNDRPVALAGISCRHDISMSYLEQLFGKLRRQGLVTSVRGPGGGYRLSQPAAQISVADIMAAVDEPPAPGPVDTTPAPGGAADRLVIDALWTSLGREISEYLSSISLESLVDRQLAAGPCVETGPIRQAIGAPGTVAPLSGKTPNSVFAFGDAMASEISAQGMDGVPRAAVKPSIALAQ